MKIKIAPSLMCADLLNLKKEIEILEKNNIDYLHIDVMDGAFVPNFTFGTDICDAIRKITKIPLDIHLMINNPENYIERFNPQKNEIISVHYESTNHVHRAIMKIKETGALPYIALNPGTPIINIENLLPDISGVLIMSVNPGYAGQKIIPQCIEKVKNLRNYLNINGYEHLSIEVDGCMSFENVKLMREAGADIFVSGSSGIYSKDNTVENAIKELRSIK